MALWLPVFGQIINAIGHAMGYRNFGTKDHSHNIYPFGIWIVGEELHNNHHADPRSAKFGHRWFEFDVGWLYIRLLQACGLARVTRVRTAEEPAYTRVARDFPPFEKTHARISIGTMEEMKKAADPIALQSVWRKIEERPDSAARLLTLHAAKGLEWPIVVPVNTMTGSVGSMTGAVVEGAGPAVVGVGLLGAGAEVRAASRSACRRAR